MSNNFQSSFLSLHGFRGLLLLNRLGLIGTNTHQTLQLLHEHEHQNSVRRKSQPCWRPASHEETDTFLLVRFGEDFAETGFYAVDGGSALDAAFQDVGGCAGGSCHGSGE